MCLTEWRLVHGRQNPFVVSSSSSGLDTKKFPGSSDCVLRTAMLTAKLNLNGLFYFSLKKIKKREATSRHAVCDLLPISWEMIWQRQKKNSELCL